MFNNIKMKRTDIKTILVIGSGPIIIGQAAEFDYAGTQACLALKEEGYKVILINSNPATIMTDKEIADKVYANSHNLHGDIKLVLNQTNPAPTVIKNAHKQHLQTALTVLGKETKQADSVEENGSEWAQAVMSDKDAKLLPKTINKNYMPDVTGMGLKDAVYLLENNGLKVEVIGFGKVKEQSIPVGSTLVKGSKVTIKLG